MITKTVLKRLPRGMGRMWFGPGMLELFQLPDGDILEIVNSGGSTRRTRKLRVTRVHYDTRDAERTAAQVLERLRAI